MDKYELHSTDGRARIIEAESFADAEAKCEAGEAVAGKVLEEIDYPEKGQKKSLGYQKKSITGGVLDIDTGGRMVKVAFSKMNVIDRDGDVIAKGAFNRTFKHKGPQGVNEIWKLIDHTASFKTQLGKPRELGIEGDYAYGITAYKDSYLWREVMWPAYEAGEVTQHSFGFGIEDAEQQKDYRLIKEVSMWEYSAVLWGANPNTPTLEVAKSIGIYRDDDSIPVKIERMVKTLKSDKFSNDDQELLMIELMQLKQAFADLQKSTGTTEKVTPSEAKAVLDMQQIALRLYNIS